MASKKALREDLKIERGRTTKHRKALISQGLKMDNLENELAMLKLKNIALEVSLGITEKALKSCENALLRRNHMNEALELVLVKALGGKE